ncbi:cell wall-binding repeat-containing protein [Microbacterium sp. ARD32]|uniref:cell wall-binding repeat-containing protein n=1 Tax=Microbacterium sp. ARD32 TaxID=2962577 RepID=UPI002882678A|nr:cell wall-binding repeat-containing protein [Microbacterium sp. ARD32]MDT0156763.1 cell wall-binding repeat-containing protein [Microbacterium sp. ARD32]
MISAARGIRLAVVGAVLAVTSVLVVPAAPAAEAAASSRVSGDDRYETAAAISKASFPDASKVERVFIVSGNGFADGLSAGPAAVATHGAVLLSGVGDLPAATAAEVRRLAPDEIVIVGGTGAVSSAVRKKLESLAPHVRRIGGIDRYETSRNVAEYAFAAGSSQVYLATGRDFPDALSGGALAVKNAAPVLLIDGGRTGIDAATRDTLRQLDAERITVFGGTGVLSSELVSAASAITGAKKSRLGGASRYETSARIAKAFGSSRTAIVATGRDYPDALSAIQLSAARGAPIVLTIPQCVSAETKQALSGARSLMIVGGVGAVRGLVASRAACQPTTSATSPWTMVNKKNTLRPLTYAPSDLRTVAGTNQLMRREAATALEKMIAAAKKEGAGRIKPGSGYRSYSTQKYMFNSAVASKGRAKAELGTARPGHSEHQSGWTMDVVACTTTNCSGIDYFGGSPQGRWTVKNAHKYGFIVRYEPGYTKITGYASEPWHLRYVGKALATDYKKGGFHTLEQYLDFPAAPSY